MTLAVGIIAILLSACLLYSLKAKDGVERPFARNWVALVAATMLVMGLFVGGAAALIVSVY